MSQATELDTQSVEEVVQSDLHCRGCSFNLRGLERSSPCPKCGKPVHVSLSVEQKELSGKLAGLPLHKQVVVLAIWPLLEQVLSFMVGFVDTYLAGHLSVQATNAIAPASYLQWLVHILQMSVGIGAAALIARAVGARHKSLANAGLGQAMVLSVIIGLASAALIFLTAPLIAHLMQLQGDTFDFCVSYLQIMSLAAPLSAMLFVGAACLRAAGDTRTPFIVLAIVNVVNAVVSWIMVWPPDPSQGMGVAGIALGTAIAWVTGAVIICAVLIGGWGGIRLRLMRLRPHWRTMKRIVRVALGSLAEAVGMWGGNFLVLMIVGVVAARETRAMAAQALGADAGTMGMGSLWMAAVGQTSVESASLGAHLIGIRIEAISYLPGVALGIAAATLTGQYLGLGDPLRAKKAGRFCLGYGAMVMGLAGAVFWFFPEALVRLVTDKQPLIDLAPDLLRICAPVQISFAAAIVLSNAMRGAGDTRATMILTYISVLGIRLPLTYVLAIELEYGLIGIWFGLCAELFLRGIIFTARYLHGGWTKANV